MRLKIWITVFILLEEQYCGFLATEAVDSINSWFEQLNIEMKVINQFTAYFAWELSVAPNDTTLKESIEFNGIKSKWVDSKCQDLDSFGINHPGPPSFRVNLNKTPLEVVSTILCSGPTFTETESEELTKVLFEMQEIFTETKICLPKHFDVCLNLDWIYEFSYARDKNGHITAMDMSEVIPRGHQKKSQLNYFDGNISGHYYILGAVPDSSRNITQIMQKIRSGPMNCLDGEPDLENLMKGDFSVLKRLDCALRTNEVFRWAWESWRLAVGKRIGHIYPIAIDIMNVGAASKGFADIGEIWRREIELPNLRSVVRDLSDQIKPFYQLLHGVLRDFLWKKVHKYESFSKYGTIPAHMLGSMWAQNWEIYQELIIPFMEVNIEKNLVNMNWTSVDMVKRSDDFYSSLGLPAMPTEFWTRSVFQKSSNFGKCHGTAANMFSGNDYRMIVCAEATWEDFYVIVHEMGHLHYYMAYNKQPIVFQDANSALQESIGDAIFLGFMAPQHLNRLRLLPDQSLFTRRSKQAQVQSTERNLNKSNLRNDKITFLGKPYPDVSTKIRQESEKPENNPDPHISDFDLTLLLKMALTKIPQIPFEYILDIFRWDLFSGNVSMDNANQHFWKLVIDEQGVHPPDWENRKDFFDPGAKYHVADNTPFVRYFLASFIQAQIFRGLCEVTVFGHVKPKELLPMPLHRCDIYGSKRAGNLLKKALSIGAEKHWTEALFILTGTREVSADALLLYYKPLIVWLEKLAEERSTPIGW